MGRPRLRDTGFLPDGLCAPGAWNAITDVPGVSVGHASVEQPGARTGVTAVLPHAGDPFASKCAAAVWALNGSGECTGSMQINEWGVLESPILLTGTPSVGRVYDGGIDWLMARNALLAAGRAWVIPCVAECNDGWLNDARAHRAGAVEVARALAAASDGPVAEGCVGGGRGMIGFGWKAGIGTASRRADAWHVGVLVNCNCGRSEELTIAGVRLAAAVDPRTEESEPPAARRDGSIIVVVATDAPLTHPGLRRLCKRAALGLARTGAVAHHGSGDIVIGFSTTGRTEHGAVSRGGPEPWGAALAPLFLAAAEATEEAVLGALFAAEDTVGRDGRRVPALPVDDVVRHLRARRPDRFPATSP